MHIFTHNQKGFTVLFAVLIASILLAVGVSIFNITVKNLLFASSGRESLKAFASADTGLECAEYWDRNGDGIFAIVGTEANTGSEAYNLAQCVGKVLTNTNSVEDGGTAWTVREPLNASGDRVKTTSFTLSTDEASGSICVDVVVTKQPKKDRVTGNIVPDKINTTIESRGHNTCDIRSQRRLERGVRITYDEL